MNLFNTRGFGLLEFIQDVNAKLKMDTSFFFYNIIEIKLPIFTIETLTMLCSYPMLYFIRSRYFDKYMFVPSTLYYPFHHLREKLLSYLYNVYTYLLLSQADLYAVAPNVLSGQFN